VADERRAPAGAAVGADPGERSGRGRGDRHT
jgi:hypothetical protein